ncbi:MAG TPA: phosphohistidine phosphatase SixA [Vicinamibacterales bacterium]|nr:phosphohistidine phosphatase SixA [Vicinamibacterales bacterium]
MATRAERRPRQKPCHLYLVRHAIAAERGRQWPDDTKRPLTHKGAARMRQIVMGLRDLGVEFDLVLTSPLVRARQTAELLIAGVRSKPTLEVTDALAPGEPPVKVAAMLAKHAASCSIALVGHEPGLGELAAWLVGANEPFVMKKGGVCCLKVNALPPARNGQVVWHATPKMLRALAK